jgi:hypothetical protein
MPFVALAGIGAIGEALVALGILAGVLLLAYLIAKFGSYVPYIGAWLASHAESFLSWSVAQISSALNGAMWALTNLVSVVVVVVTYPFALVARFTIATANTFWYIRYVVLPNLQNAVVSLIYAEAQSAYNYAFMLYGWAVSYVNQQVQRGFDYTLALYYQAVNTANSYLGLAYQYAQTLYYGAISYAATEVSALRSLVYSYVSTLAGEIAALRQTMYAALGLVAQGLEAEIISAEAKLTALILQYAAAAEKDAITAVDLIGATALTDVWPNLITDVDGILAEIPQELIDIRDQIASIPRALPAGLLEALTALGALAIPLLRYLKDCGVPMCRDMHGLSDLLGGLAEAGTDAALFGIIALCVTDPHGAAREISDVAGPVAREAESLFKSLLGV